MIAGLSKAVILYLAPLLMITALLLSIFAYLSPVVMLQDRVALLTVTPLVQAGSTQSVDGPSIFLGVLGIVTLQTLLSVNQRVLYRLLLAYQQCCSYQLHKPHNFTSLW